jgi:hypothetical protein
MKLSIKHKGINCVEKQHSRGAFKYLTVYVLEDDCSSRTGSWRKELSPAKIDSVDAEQKILGGKRNGNGLQLLFRLFGLTAGAFPSNPNGREYTGYFDSSSSILNRLRLI